MNTPATSQKVEPEPLIDSGPIIRVRSVWRAARPAALASVRDVWGRTPNASRSWLRHRRVTISCWLTRNGTGHALLSAGGWVALAAVLVYRVLTGSLDAGQESVADDLRKEPALLDSFSEPSVACALLKQEATRLLLLYREQHDRQKPKPAAQSDRDGDLAPRPGPHQTTEYLAAGNPAGSQSSEVQSLLALDGLICDLHLDLSHKVLQVHLDQHSWNQFVDRYLEVVRGNPARDEAVLYFDGGWPGRRNVVGPKKS
jgi:hypothetical protein